MTVAVRFSCLIASCLLAGCSWLPAHGPDHRRITTNAVASSTVERRAVAYDYVLIDISDDVIDAVRKISLGSFYRSFGLRHSSPPVMRVGKGDVLGVAIFESAAGGLFVPAEGGLRAGNSVSLPPQVVGSSGTISVPYAGSVRASGRTLRSIQREIERKLSSRAVEPQVVMSLVQQTSAPVTLVGETTSQLQLRPKERLLDVIGRSGGEQERTYELFVTVQRRGISQTVHFPRLIEHSKENIYMHPGDVVFVHRKPQKFVAVGAVGAAGQESGVTGIFDFEQENLSLNEAIAKAGGLLNSRSNAAGVFIYRTEYRDTVEKMGVDTSRFPPGQKFIPTVYRANFRDPSSFFFAQRFPIRHKDAIYVTNARSVELEKFLLHTTTVTSSIAGVATDYSAVRNVIRGQ